jgi:hypothetical protein
MVRDIMHPFKKPIELSRLSDIYTDLYDADKMVNNCNPKIIDTICKLETFLEKYKESRDTSDYNVIFKDTERIKKEFIDNCII